MDIEAARIIAKSIAIMMIGFSAVGQGYIIGKTQEAIGRNPEMEGSLFTKMLIGAAIAESTAIYGLVTFFII